MNSILTVCTGNICRSPLAAALLQARFGMGYHVDSCGIAAVVGHPATAEAIQVAGKQSLDITSHRAKQLDELLASRFELLLVMEHKHKQWVTFRLPQARGRTFTIGHWRGVEVPDPYGGSLEDYASTFGLIELCMEDWVGRIGPEASTSPRLHSAS